MRVCSFILTCLVAALSGLLLSAQNADPGRTTFESFCARCHGADGKGGEMGPPIVVRLADRDDQQLAKLIHEGLPDRGMPPSLATPAELPGLITFLRNIQRRGATDPVTQRTLRVETTAGATLDGQVLGEGFDEVQLRTPDQRVHLLRRAGERFREVTSDTDWPTYNGDPRGNRYTTLTEINKDTIARLAVRWIFTLPGTGELQVTPVVVSGLMYVAGVNECYALDAGSGRQIWRYRRARTPGLSTGGHANRGVAVAGDRVFLETDNAHTIALNRFTGELLWDAEPT